MKRILFLGLIAFWAISGYSQQKKSPLEGTWKMVIGDPKIDVDTSFQTMMKAGQIKTFSKEYFTFVGHYERNDTVFYKGYGAGTYKLDGDRYEEHILYHNDSTLIGTKYRCLLEIRNDTLFQKCSTDNNWKLQKDFGTEKYIRLK